MKLGIIGSYDITHKSVCGQSDKTELFEKKLREKIGSENIRFVNTYLWKQKKMYLFKDVIFTFLSCRNIVIMTSVNGTKVLYLIARLFKYFTKKNIYHVVIGGKQNVELLRKNHRYLAIAQTLDGIYVEIQQMVKEYNDLGVKKVKYIPNCKDIKRTNDINLDRNDSPYKFCVYSKINREKGVPEAIEAIVKMNEKRENCCRLDIYGVIDNEYKSEFEKKISEYASFIQFHGKIDREKSLEILSKYFALLFPTHHPEGVPGAMIDAYEAGLPIIACNTYYISNIIKNNYSGILYEENDDKGLVEVLEQVINTPDLIVDMRQNCRTEAMKYNSKDVIKQMVEHMKLR